MTERKLEVDWSRTQAFTVEADSIYVNLQGREGEGTVTPNEYGQVCDSLVQLLNKLEDQETGEKVIESVYRSSEEYWGPYVEFAPDLVFQTKRGYRLSATFGPKGLVVSNTLRRTFQDRTGIFIACSPELKNNFIIEGARIFDVIPTILHILGFEVPDDMDGSVLTDIFLADSVTANRRVTYRKGSSKRVHKYEESILSLNDKEKVIEKLRGLGYLQE